MADDKITLTDWGRTVLINKAARVINDAVLFLPLPIWATTGKGAAVKISSIGITVVTPAVRPIYDIEGVPIELGLALEILRQGIELPGEVTSLEALKDVLPVTRTFIQWEVGSNGIGTIWTRVFVAGVLDP